jgi:phosphoacetylglucosamine mutase
METLRETLEKEYSKHPYSIFPNQELPYGTAGFRSNASQLDSVMFTVGLLAVLRSLSMNGQTIGVMITASHNEVQDNGVKLIDPLGEMLDQKWEPIAVLLANSPDSEQLFKNLVQIMENFELLFFSKKEKKQSVASIYVGRDTRPSSEPFTRSLIDGILVFQKSGLLSNIHIKDYGLVTTPQLHYMVYLKNNNLKELNEDAQLTTYYENLSSAYKRMIHSLEFLGKKRILYVDCAFGVGGPALKGFREQLVNQFEFYTINDASDTDLDLSIVHQKLNKNCGAEYVQKQRKVPENFDKQLTTSMASIDGDADRLVYFFVNENSPNNNELYLIDGDKIATLISKFINEQLETVDINHLELGIVQTAYANGASTQYMKQHCVKKPENVCCVATGVKHLHHRAARFDIGVYFEANGHGTVLFSAKARSTIEQKYSAVMADESASHSLKLSITRLRALIDLVNPAVGDAFSDMLLCEAILHIYGWDHKQWYHKLYQDYPSVQTKKHMADPNFRSKMKTTEDETRLEKPEALQKALDQFMSQFPGGRTFIRPSGTENVVRVYAEAPTQSEAEILAQSVEQLISQFLR